MDKFLVTYLNECCWPEPVGTYDTYEMAEAIAMGTIAMAGKTVEQNSGEPNWDEPVTHFGAPSAIPFAMIGTQTDSYHSYLIHRVWKRK